MIGHASPRTTYEVYLHLFPSDENEERSRLAGIADRFPSLRGMTIKIGNTVVPLRLAKRIDTLPAPKPGKPR
jgi:hypothetical protein